MAMGLLDLQTGQESRVVEGRGHLADTPALGQGRAVSTDRETWFKITPYFSHEPVERQGLPTGQDQAMEGLAGEPGVKESVLRGRPRAAAFKNRQWGFPAPACSGPGQEQQCQAGGFQNRSIGSQRPHLQHGCQERA